MALELNIFRIIPDEVQERLLDSYYSPAALRESISQERSRFFVATSQGSIIGYAQFYQREGEDRIAELLRIYVLPEWQRAGIGGLLLSEGLSYLAQKMPAGFSQCGRTILLVGFTVQGFLC
jgi:ribosomal protein S18 acetylase RimI-like enzyme